MARRVVFEPDAWDEYHYWSLTNRKKQEKIYELIKEIQRSPYDGIGKPEPLRYQKQGYWSRRIDSIHRLVYEATEDYVSIVSCKHHYDNE